VDEGVRRTEIDADIARKQTEECVDQVELSLSKTVDRGHRKDTRD